MCYLSKKKAMSQPELITRMLQYAISRCAFICRNLNTETLGYERGPDCARQIEKESDRLIQETLSIQVTLADGTYNPVIDTCDQGHKFAKLPDHPKRDGISRCPYCMAIGLDGAREEIKRLEQRPLRTTYAETVAWLGSEEGKKSMAEAMASANVSIEALNTERTVDRSLLHQPFGLEDDIHSRKT